jgi:Rod binding domain-containing protein
MNRVDLSQAAAAATAATATQPNPRLVSAAHEFEASLMKEFLKPLQHDSLFSEDSAQGDDDSGGSHSALMDFGSEAMAKAISERGGFGIARKILNDLQVSGDHSQAVKQAPETHA